MKHLIIIGARGYGREVFSMAHETVAFVNHEWDIKGFLDDNSDALEGFSCGLGLWPPILSSVEDYVVQPDDVFVCALGDPEYRRKYTEKIIEKGGAFISIISPDSHVDKSAKIGPGCILSRWSCVSTNVTLGRGVMIHPYTNVGHDAKIGDYVSLESHVFVGGGAEIGDESVMHVRSGIIPHKRIGRKCSVGFGSGVMRNFKDGLHVFGLPAKILEF